MFFLTAPQAPAYASVHGPLQAVLEGLALPSIEATRFSGTASPRARAHLQRRAKLSAQRSRRGRMLPLVQRRNMPSVVGIGTELLSLAATASTRRGNEGIFPGDVRAVRGAQFIAFPAKSL